ncbi:MAG: hypothetical protein KUG82_17460 [Pseudomonadales bacterium]|nr:hypothetical protein [Pseudomonadales bacterium]
MELNHEFELEDDESEEEAMISPLIEQEIERYLQDTIQRNSLSQYIHQLTDDSELKGIKLNDGPLTQ